MSQGAGVVDPSVPPEGSLPAQPPKVNDPAPAIFGKTVPSQASQYKYAAEQSVATLKAQRDELTALRTRAVQMMTFLGAATTFLAGTVLKGAGTRDGLYQIGLWIGVVFAATTVLMFGVILIGRPDAFRMPGRPRWLASQMNWAFHLRGDILTSWIDDRAPEATYYRQITIEARQMELRNQIRLKAIRGRYDFFVFSILAQLGVWIVLAVMYG
jgi:hypothetical protein